MKDGASFIRYTLVMCVRKRLHSRELLSFFMSFRSDHWRLFILILFVLH